MLYLIKDAANPILALKRMLAQRMQDPKFMPALQGIEGGVGQVFSPEATTKSIRRHVGLPHSTQGFRLSEHPARLEGVEKIYKDPSMSGKVKAEHNLSEQTWNALDRSTAPSTAGAPTILRKLTTVFNPEEQRILREGVGYGAAHPTRGMAGVLGIARDLGHIPPEQIAAAKAGFKKNAPQIAAHPSTGMMLEEIQKAMKLPLPQLAKSLPRMEQISGPIRGSIGA
jgi:hypothetical protein